MTAPVTAPGFYPHLTPDEYFAEPCPAPALTNSGIGTLLGRSPAHFAHAHPALNPDPELRRASMAMHHGSLVHRLALGKGDDYAVIEADDWRTKSAKEQRDAAEAAGKIPVLSGKFAEAETQALLVQASIERALDGATYDTEVVVAWTETARSGAKVWCRALVDVWCPSRLLAIDLKTTADASDAALIRLFANGYARQDAWYTRGLEKVTGAWGRVSFAFLFVETGGPFATRVVDCSGGFRDGAWEDCARAIDLFADCLTTNRWPGYEPLRVLPPNWWLRQREERAALEGIAA